MVVCLRILFLITMSEGDILYGTSLPMESVKVIAESVGVANLPDETAKQLADEVSYRLKQIIQVSFINND